MTINAPTKKSPAVTSQTGGRQTVSIHMKTYPDEKNFTSLVDYVSSHIVLQKIGGKMLVWLLIMSLMFSYFRVLLMRKVSDVHVNMLICLRFLSD